MTATAQAPVQKPKLFKPPEVEVGRVVVWKHSPSDLEGSPAMVTSTNGHNLCLIVFFPSFMNGSVKSGVLHHDDPFLFSPGGGMRSEGCWHLTDRDKAIDKVLSELGK